MLPLVLGFVAPPGLHLGPKEIHLYFISNIMYSEGDQGEGAQNLIPQISKRLNSDTG